MTRRPWPEGRLRFESSGPSTLRFLFLLGLLVLPVLLVIWSQR